MSKPIKTSIKELLSSDNINQRDRNLWIVTDYSEKLIKDLEMNTGVTSGDCKRPEEWMNKNCDKNINYIHFNYSYRKKCLGFDCDIQYLNLNDFKNTAVYIPSNEFIEYVSLVIPKDIIKRTERVNWKISKKNKLFLQNVVTESRGTVSFVSKVLDCLEDNPKLLAAVYKNIEV